MSLSSGSTLSWCRRPMAGEAAMPLSLSGSPLSWCRRLVAAETEAGKTEEEVAPKQQRQRWVSSSSSSEYRMRRCQSPRLLLLLLHLPALRRHPQPLGRARPSYPPEER